MAPAKRATTTTSGGASADDAADDVERANAANDEDDGEEDGADAGEEDGEELGEEDANRVRDARVPSVPRDAVVVREILKSMGVTDVEQKVINQGMEFMHRYTSEVLAEASIASKHAKKTTLDVEDVKLGAKAVLLSQFVDPPSLGDAHAMANAVNKNPLPKLSERPGIHVPTELNLLSDNYDIGPARAHEVAADLEKQAEAKAAAAAAAAAAAIASSSKATEPSAMGAHDPLAFEVKGKAADEPTAADVGDFAEFMMDDDDMEE